MCLLDHVPVDGHKPKSIETEQIGLHGFYLTFKGTQIWVGRGEEWVLGELGVGTEYIQNTLHKILKIQSGGGGTHL